MQPDYVVPALIAIWILYWIGRLVLLEALTLAFRRIPPVRAWFRRQTEAGRFNRGVRSSAVFSDAFRGLADAAEWVAGRGWLRAPLFVFVAAILIFLSILPMDQVRAAKADYDGALVALRDADLAQTAMGLCAMENAFAESGRRTGLTLAPPANFKPYPFGPETGRLWETIGGERQTFMALALLDGRVLTDDPAAVLPLYRAVPALAQRLDALIVNGRLIGQGYRALPNDPVSEAASEDIRAICDGDPGTRSERLAPVRNPEDYIGLATRFQTRALAFLKDPAVREAYYGYQVQVAASRFGLAFAFALATAMILWASLKLAIGLARLPRRSIWLLANWAFMTALCGVCAIGVSAVLLGAQTTVNALSPYASAYVLAAASDPAREAELQRQADVLLDGVFSVAQATCADIGEPSPFQGWCQGLSILSEPWDPETGRFDFDRAIPTADGADPATVHLTEKLSRAPMTFVIAYAGVDKATQDRFDVSLWQGVRMGGFALLLLLPWLILAGLAAALALALELRWTVVKRIDRIVR